MRYSVLLPVAMVALASLLSSSTAVLAGDVGWKNSSAISARSYRRPHYSWYLPRYYYWRHHFWSHNPHVILGI